MLARELPKGLLSQSVGDRVSDYIILDLPRVFLLQRVSIGGPCELFVERYTRFGERDYRRDP